MVATRTNDAAYVKTNRGVARDSERKVTKSIYSNHLSHLAVRLLESRTGGSTTVLLGLAPARITDQQVTVVFYQSFSEFILRLFVNVLCVVGNNRLGNCGADGIDLRSDTTTLDANTNVEVAEFVLTHNKNRFEHLQPHRFGLDQLNGLSIDFDKATTLLGESHGSSGLLPVIQQGGRNP
jgi:hypothetical protein